MSRAPAEAEIDESSGYLEAFERVFRLHEQGKSFSGREPNCAFLNTGGSFADISAGSGLSFPDDARGLAAVDWDQDGDLDLWFANRTAPQLRFMRNDSDRRNRFLRLRLQGEESNRDAVGARVELAIRTEADELVSLARTVRAGDGFLSQSSKWLHFGLGSAGTVVGGTVRWPSGLVEELPPLPADRHYRLAEGGRGPIEWEPADRDLALAADELSLPEPTTPERVVFAARAPMPSISYRSFDGEWIRPTDGLDSPLLVNLWATWCLPCVAELEDLAGAAPRLTQANLSVLALSVDGLDEEQLTTAEDARAFLSRLGFPHAAGLADEQLLSKLQILHDNLFSTHLEFAIPTSFLVDERGALAAVYRGPVDVDRLIEDTRNLSAGAERRRQLAAPLPGRWLAPPQELRLTSFAKRFAEEGFPGESARYSRLELERRPDDRNLRLELARQLLLRGDGPGAIDVLRQGLELNQSDGILETVLTGILLDQSSAALAGGNLELAEELISEALDLVPDHVDALSDLGILRLEQGRLEEAESLVRRAIEIDPEAARPHNNLGVVLARRGDLAAAIESLERALALDPGLADARSNLEAIRAVRTP